jgi:predicted membrane protein
LSGDSDFILRFINEIDEFHSNAIKPAEYLSFVTDLKLDFSTATIPEGETNIRFNGFVNEIKLTSSENVGLKISARGFVNNSKINGREENNIFAPFEYESPDYDIQTRKVFIQTLSFVSEIEIN